MIDITPKYETLRTARASAVVKASPEALAAVREKRVPKGDVLEVARVAGIQAAKRTHEVIPFCHPLPIEHAAVTVAVGDGEIRIETEVKATAKTGVEMEALHAASVAALTVYDMLKPIDDALLIGEIRLLEKKGGKSDLAGSFPKGLKAGVLVVSDSVSAKTRVDKSGRLIVDRLIAAGVAVEDCIAVADEVPLVVKALRSFIDRKFDLVLSTGGTGLGPRDVTVEATRQVVEREAPGIAEALRGYGQRRTPYAMLSRGIAGVCGKTLIVNLPGSSRGVAEGLNVMIPAVLHVFPIMEGAGH